MVFYILFLVVLLSYAMCTVPTHENLKIVSCINTLIHTHTHMIIIIIMIVATCDQQRHFHYININVARFHYCDYSYQTYPQKMLKNSDHKALIAVWNNNKLRSLPKPTTTTTTTKKGAQNNQDCTTTRTQQQQGEKAGKVLKNLNFRFFLLKMPLIYLISRSYIWILTIGFVKNVKAVPLIFHSMMEIIAVV